MRASVFRIAAETRAGLHRRADTARWTAIDG